MALAPIVLLGFLATVNGTCSTLIEEMPFFLHLSKPCGTHKPHSEIEDFSKEKLEVEMMHLIGTITVEVKKIHLSMNSPECAGLNLESMPKIPEITDDIDSKEVYSILYHHVANVMSVAREHVIFPLTCSNNSQHLSFGFRRLGAKLILLQCLFLQRLPTGTEINHNIRFHFQSDCSSRQTRDCLVLLYTYKVLSLILPSITNANVTEYF